MVTLEDLASEISNLKAQEWQHDLFGVPDGDLPTVKVVGHSVGFSVYVEAWGNHFLFGIGDPANSPDQDVAGGALNWEKTLQGEFLARELACDPQEFESFNGEDTWYGIATGSETWTLAEVLDKIRQVIEYA